MRVLISIVDCTLWLLAPYDPDIMGHDLSFQRSPSTVTVQCQSVRISTCHSYQFSRINYFLIILRIFRLFHLMKNAIILFNLFRLSVLLGSCGSASCVPSDWTESTQTLIPPYLLEWTSSSCPSVCGLMSCLHGLYSALSEDSSTLSGQSHQTSTSGSG